ncbi:MAG: ATP-binding protein [Sorangiineae bacterium]|nr:ATP-binding protein [Polyangiaceae bacterium]MEB2325062.1 ATP-binding protein [Sorangiineae bacterium]
MTRLIIVAAASIGFILFVAFVVSRLLLTRTRGMSIRMQVFIALAVVMGAFAFGLGLMVIDRIEARAVRIAMQAATDEATSISGIIEGEMVRSGVHIGEIAERLEQERRRGADLRLELLDDDGRVLFPRGQASAVHEPGTVAVDHPILVGPRTVGAVRVVKPTVVMRRLLADFAPTVLVISLVLGAAAGLAAGFIGRAIAHPLERLAIFAERVSTGERVASPPAPFGREVTRLTRSIDSMRRQLEGRPFVEAFAADLSHELKNPVAAIRASAELLEEGALEEPEEARRFVGRIREASGRIERLLGDLLGLARIEARGVESAEPVELAAIARTALEASAHGGRVTLGSSGDTRVRGDLVWLTRAVGNLLDNALVHSTEGSPVRVSVCREEAQVTLTVTSAGAIERHVKPRLFRRFVTTRASRGGTGLGLAIVRAVVESHGGSVELASAGPPEVRFRVALPPARRSTAEQLREAVELSSEPRHPAPDPPLDS